MVYATDEFADEVHDKITTRFVSVEAPGGTSAMKDTCREYTDAHNGRAITRAVMTAIAEQSRKVREEIVNTIYSKILCHNNLKKFHH